MKDKSLFRGFRKQLFFSVVFIFLCSFVFSSPLYSPAWGFSMDLPEGYAYTGGDGKDRFSFEDASGAKFDLVVYHAEAGGAPPYDSVEALAQDVQRRLNNSGDADSFEYRHKKCFVIQLSFSIQGARGRASPYSGWALCMELGLPNSQSNNAAAPESRADPRPMLLAMAYGPADKKDLNAFYFSALDSIAPEAGDKLASGPITEYTYPRLTRKQAPVFGLGIEAQIFAEDAEAAQALVDREFQVLRRYENAPNWKEAWQRFYRAIYRDSFDRLADVAFQVERKLNVPPREDRDMAEQALHWVQSFTYERDLAGSDFVNLVSAATEGKGDCDCRALLWAVILRHANIRSGIMVSRQYSHAMGLADLPGTGARFELDGQKFLVAETTATVSIGLIGEKVSEREGWLGIVFE